MSFEFVDNAGIDRRARKLIRSHVMKGKNAGRTVTRASRKLLIRRQEHDVIKDAMPPVETQDKDLIATCMWLLNRRCSLSLFPFDIYMDTRLLLSRKFAMIAFHELLELMCSEFEVVNAALYPVEFCRRPSDEHRTRCLQYMIADEACKEHS